MLRKDHLKHITLFLLLISTLNATAQNDLNKQAAIETYNGYFIENKGQIVDQDGIQNDKVLYLLNTEGLNVQLKKTGFSYDIYEKMKKKMPVGSKAEASPNFNFHKLKSKSDSLAIETQYHRIDIDFLNTSDDLFVEKGEASKSYFNYYSIVGHEEGITHVQSFKKIIYKNLYKGIDLEFFVPENPEKPVEYNFIINPGGDLSNIKMKISGAEVSLKNNALNMNVIHGDFKEVIPKSWVKSPDGDKEIAITYEEKNKNEFGFMINNKNFDKKSTLVIDPTPVRQWATYFGGAEDESYFVGDVETDSQGNVYIAGYSQSTTNIATTGAFQTSLITTANAYLAKFASDGSIMWGTYYGGTGSGNFTDLTLDGLDNIIAVGSAGNGPNVATPGAHQEINTYSEYGGGIVIKFDSDGARLWGTYYGGEWGAGILSVITDANRNIYFAGTTASNNGIATLGAFKEVGNVNVHFNWDAFLVKMDENGVRQWGTYYGGDGHEDISELGIDSSGFIYFTGTTSSFEGISTAGAYQEEFSYDTLLWNDAYLVKFTPDGNRLWGTYFGGYDYDFGYGLTIDSKNNIIISGNTRSNEKVATANSHQPNKGGASDDWDAFLAKFNQNGNLLWSTYYGGGDSEDWGGDEVAVDSNDNIFLLGSTRSSNNISTPNAYQDNLSSYSNSFLVKFDPLGVREWGTYYGGNVAEYALAIDVTTQGEIYALGWTWSNSGISSPGAYQENYGGKRDAFLVKFKDCLSSINATATEFLCAGEAIEFTASGGISYSWSGPNGFTSTDPNPKILNASVNDSGTYSVYVESGGGCDDTRTFEILVSDKPVANPIQDIQVCENVYGTGISSNIDTSNVESQLLGNQTGMVVSYFDGNGNALSSPLPNPMTNTIANLETITVRVSNENNSGCYDETTFNLVVNPLPEVFAIDDIYECDDDTDGFTNFDLSGVESLALGGRTGLSVACFDENGNAIPNPLPTNYTNSLAGQETLTVRVSNDNTGCYNETTFNIIVNPLPIANTLDELVGCDDNNDGISEYFDTSIVEETVLGGQTGMEVSYYNSSGNLLPSPLPDPYTNAVTYLETLTVRVTNPITGCFAETPLVLRTSLKPQISQPETLYACDAGNGFGSFDTSTIEAQLIGSQTGLNLFYFDGNGNALPSPLPTFFTNTQAWSQTIFVKVENALNSSCYSETTFNLVVNELPSVEIDDTYFLCNLEPYLEVSIDPNLDTYEWNYQDGSVVSNTFEAQLIDAGIYTIKVGQWVNGILCENTFDFELVRSILPTISDVKFQELSDHNFIEIIATGDGDFEYSIDGNTYQDSNLFHNVLGGIYTVHVRDKHGCGEDVRVVTLIDYPKFFTPNGDGFNDFWQIRGITEFPNSKIFIYDRFGKLLKEMAATSIGWNGSFNGAPMPSDDYWFSVLLEDGREVRGHFALKL